VTRVGDGYLNTLGIALLRGRDFADDDGAGSEKVPSYRKRSPTGSSRMPKRSANG
jgi:hypothetical protein